MRRSLPARRPVPLAEPLRPLRLARVRWVLAATAAEGALAFGRLAFVPTLLGQRFGFSVTGAGAAMALYGLGGLLFSRVAARWVARLAERGLARSGGAMVVATLLALAHGSGVATALVSCFCSGLGFHMLHSTLQAHATQMAPQARGRAVAVFACALFLGQSAGVMVVAAGIDHGMDSAVFTLAAAGMLVWRRANGLRGERALA